MFKNEFIVKKNYRTQFLLTKTHVLRFHVRTNTYFVSFDVWFLRIRAVVTEFLPTRKELDRILQLNGLVS